MVVTFKAARSVVFSIGFGAVVALLAACNGADDESVRVGVQGDALDPTGCDLRSCYDDPKLPTVGGKDPTGGKGDDGSAGPVKYTTCGPLLKPYETKIQWEKTPFYGNSRLTPATKDPATGKLTVPCVNMDAENPKVNPACPIDRANVMAVKNGAGGIDFYVQEGQRISNDNYNVAVTKVTPVKDKRGNVVALNVPCVDPGGADVSGTLVDTALAGACRLEVLLSADNASGMKNENYATLDVCNATTNPDGASPSPSNPSCLIGWGAALNDVYGTERDDRGNYRADADHCHVALVAGYEAPAAKRPNTAFGKTTKSAIVWRPVAAGVPIANE